MFEKARDNLLFYVYLKCTYVTTYIDTYNLHHIYNKSSYASWGDNVSPKGKQGRRGC